MIAAVDIGASKTLIARFPSTRNSQPTDKIRFETPQDKEELLELLIETLGLMKDIQVVSVGVPGVVRGGTVSSNANLPWENWPLQQLLHDRLRMPVLIENDANLAALAESHTLEQLPKVGLYLTISTGIGSGIIINGKLPPELSGSEAGLMVFERLGGFIDWEHITSGKAIREKYNRLAEELDVESWEDVANDLCTGLLAIIPLLRPEVIIFGGSVGIHLDKFYYKLKSLLEQRLPHIIACPELKKASYETDSVLYGCRQYALNVGN